MSIFLPGILLAVFSGLLNGVFTLPMKFLGRWSWENDWAVFIVVSCLFMPADLVLLTVSSPWLCLQQGPAARRFYCPPLRVRLGIWRPHVRAGRQRFGISADDTLVLAISASLGSFLPIMILAPAILVRDQGKAILLGTTVGIIGVALCGHAGMRRERANAGTDSQRKMVGEARPFGIGFLLCAGSGLLSAVFNIGCSSAQAIATSARQLGNSAFAGSNLIWLLMLGAGAVANLGFCGYLLGRNRSRPKFSQPDWPRLGGLSVVMRVLWGGQHFVYGLAAPKLG